MWESQTPGSMLFWNARSLDLDSHTAHHGSEVAGMLLFFCMHFEQVVYLLVAMKYRILIRVYTEGNMNQSLSKVQ